MPENTEINKIEKDIDWDAMFADYLWGVWHYTGAKNETPVHTDYRHEDLAIKYGCNKSTVAMKASVEKWHRKRDEFRRSDKFSFLNYKCTHVNRRLMVMADKAMNICMLDIEELEAQAIADSEVKTYTKQSKTEKAKHRATIAALIVKTGQMAFQITKEITADLNHNAIEFAEANPEARASRIDTLQKQVAIARKKLKKADAG